MTPSSVLLPVRNARAHCHLARWDVDHDRIAQHFQLSGPFATTVCSVSRLVDLMPPPSDAAVAKYLWITDSIYLRVSRSNQYYCFHHASPTTFEGYEEPRWMVIYFPTELEPFAKAARNDSEETDGIAYCIHAKDDTSASEGLYLLTSLPDTWSRRLQIHQPEHSRIRWDANHQPKPCPFTVPQLETVLIQPGRTLVWREGLFSVEQSACLATKCHKFYLTGCRFADGGKAYVDELLQDSALDNLKRCLEWTETMPFNEAQFGRLLKNLSSQPNGRPRRLVQSLRLCGGRDLNEEKSADLALADLDELVLKETDLLDGGKALLQALWRGGGPRKLVLLAPSWSPFTTEEATSMFAKVLGSPYSRLEELELRVLMDSAILFSGLCLALRLSRSLVSVKLLFIMDISIEEWGILMTFLREQTSIQRLTIILEPSEQGDGMERHHRSQTRAHFVSNMLQYNRNLSYINCDTNIFDPTVWKKHVQPKILYNRFIKRYLPPIEDQQRQAAAGSKQATALIGEFLCRRSSSSASILWEIVHRNHNVLVAEIE